MRTPAADSETSWENVSEWYGRLSGKGGHYYHQHIVLPRSLRLLELKADSALLDLACGQGVLARQIPAEVAYTGVDIAPSLINQARRLDKDRKHVYVVADVSRDLPIIQRDFSHASIILALQNIKDPEGVISNARVHLERNGRFLIVLNHPCFRIPRQTRWDIDPQNKLQYRRVDRYMTPMKIPFAVSPSRGERSEKIWSYHFPLSHYSQWLLKHGFVIEKIEEWISDKHSTGRAARMENQARKEFPLFLAILARKD
ncbi:MAG: methyltransferase domain-containing protein [Chloroflexi bacterium]|nr:methyltransferase domain-containing protein [Chloroflexota bacterium]